MNFKLTVDLYVTLTTRTRFFSPYFSSSYIVNCDSTTAATLTETIVDDAAESGTTKFSVTFDQTAGVVPGTIYECSVKMEKDGYTSAKSFPSVVITPDASTGMLL